MNLDFISLLKSLEWEFKFVYKKREWWGGVIRELGNARGRRFWCGSAFWCVGPCYLRIVRCFLGRLELRPIYIVQNFLYIYFRMKTFIYLFIVYIQHNIIYFKLYPIKILFSYFPIFFPCTTTTLYPFFFNHWNA